MNFFKRYSMILEKAYFSILRNGYKRADYLRKHNTLAEIGSDVYYFSRIFPADPKFLKIKNNVIIATNVRFLNHDRVDLLLYGIHKRHFDQYHACIEVGNNVFIGADVVVLPDVKIGDNCIIGAGSVVTKDLESGGVYAGIPAKKVGTYDKFISKRMSETLVSDNPKILWKKFYESRKGNKNGSK